jgi:hypothetical protein
MLIKPGAYLQEEGRARGLPTDPAYAFLQDFDCSAGAKYSFNLQFLNQLPFFTA